MLKTFSFSQSDDEEFKSLIKRITRSVTRSRIINFTLIKSATFNQFRDHVTRH